MKLIDTSTSLVYKGQEKFLIAVDCIIFGFDAENLKLLLLKFGMNLNSVNLENWLQIVIENL